MVLGGDTNFLGVVGPSVFGRVQIPRRPSLPLLFLSRSEPLNCRFPEPDFANPWFSHDNLPWFHLGVRARIVQRVPFWWQSSDLAQVEFLIILSLLLFDTGRGIPHRGRHVKPHKSLAPPSGNTFFIDDLACERDIEEEHTSISTATLSCWCSRAS